MIRLTNGRSNGVNAEDMLIYKVKESHRCRSRSDHWRCSLVADHEGVHEGWSDHIIRSDRERFEPGRTWNTEDETNPVGSSTISFGSIYVSLSNA